MSKVIEHIKIKMHGLKTSVNAFIDKTLLSNVKTTCDSITLGDYLSVICHEKYEKLLKLHKYTPKRIILQGLAMLLNDYEALTTSADVRLNKEKQAKIIRKGSRREIVYGCYLILKNKESKIVMDYLLKEHIIEPNEDRLKAFKRCIAELKGLDIEIDSLITKTERKRPSMTDYNQEIARISKYLGFTIKKDIALSLYIGYQNEYRDYINELERQHNGTRNHR
jgi:hypothetical protein